MHPCELTTTTKALRIALRAIGRIFWVCQAIPADRRCESGLQDEGPQIGITDPAHARIVPLGHICCETLDDGGRDVQHHVPAEAPCAVPGAHETGGGLSRHEVDECVALALARREATRYIHKVIETLKTTRVQLPQYVELPHGHWQIPHHKRGHGASRLRHVNIIC